MVVFGVFAIARVAGTHALRRRRRHRLTFERAQIVRVNAIELAEAAIVAGEFGVARLKVQLHQIANGRVTAVAFVRVTARVRHRAATHMVAGVVGRRVQLTVVGDERLARAVHGARRLRRQCAIDGMARTATIATTKALRLCARRTVFMQRALLAKQMAEHARILNINVII